MLAQVGNHLAGILDPAGSHQLLQRKTWIAVLGGEACNVEVLGRCVRGQELRSGSNPAAIRCNRIGSDLGEITSSFLEVTRQRMIDTQAITPLIARVGR